MQLMSRQIISLVKLHSLIASNRNRVGENDGRR
jgi:hypothetical protein